MLSFNFNKNKNVGVRGDQAWKQDDCGGCCVRFGKFRKDCPLFDIKQQH